VSNQLSSSIALCCYNGEAYISEQLNSFLTQTILPTELIVCDDGSTDKTLDIVNCFAKHAPFHVQVIRNPHTLGSTKNFEKAISLCSSDIIFLSDQDDLWHNEKIALTLQAFSDHQVIAAFSNAQIVDSNNQPFGYDLWQRLSFKPQQLDQAAQPLSFATLVKHNVVTGATLAFRKQLRPCLLPIPQQWIHDAWIALTLSTQGVILPIEQPLINYRQHATNQIGAIKVSLYQRLQQLANRHVDSQDYLDEAIRYQQAFMHIEVTLNPDQKKLFSDKIKHFQFRGGLGRARFARLPIIIQELINGRYHHFAYGWQSVAIDLLCQRRPATRSSKS